MHCMLLFGRGQIVLSKSFKSLFYTIVQTFFRYKGLQHLNFSINCEQTTECQKVFQSVICEMKGRANCSLLGRPLLAGVSASRDWAPRRC